jgi:hypothetical protein
MSFHHIFNDTLLVLPAGDFYIGWYQKSMFNLDVGWDMNCGNQRDIGPSEYLYYKVFGKWSNLDLPDGELMMRPFVGTRRTIGVEDYFKPVQKLYFYPNPARNKITFDLEYAMITIHDLEGRVVYQGEDRTWADVSSLKNGLYIVTAKTADHNFIQSKLLIFAN